MTTQNDSPVVIEIVSIQDTNQRGFLSFDLLQILESMKELVRGYEWIVVDIECTGEPVPIGTVLSTDLLIAHARRVQQTINGTILGWPRENLASADLESIRRIGNFPWTPARVAILAVDSSYFEVISKDRAIIERIRETFLDVRNRDPRDYWELGGQ